MGEDAEGCKFQKNNARTGGGCLTPPYSERRQKMKLTDSMKMGEDHTTSSKGATYTGSNLLLAKRYTDNGSGLGKTRMGRRENYRLVYPLRRNRPLRGVLATR